MKKSIFTPILLLLVLFVLHSNSLIAARAREAPGVRLLWLDSIKVDDVAVSGDGQWLAVADQQAGEGGSLIFFASESSSPVWWWSSSEETFLSVVISYDGEQVVLGTSAGYICYFDDSRTRTGLQESPTWRSQDLGGEIERRTVDISADGRFVLVGGTGETVYYFADCRARSTLDEEPTWSDYPQGANDIRVVDLSPDGQFIAVGGSTFSLDGFVAFYKHANKQPYPTGATWNAQGGVDDPIIDLKLSAKGRSVVAVAVPVEMRTLYYWHDAASLSGDPDTTWSNTLPYSCVDMSMDGDKVATGTSVLAPACIHFWANAETLTGENRSETWTRHEEEDIFDVVMSYDGEVIAAVAESTRLQTSEYWAYFCTSAGTSLGEYQLDSLSDKISMSGDGGIVAVGGEAIDSLYVFRVTRPTAVGGWLGDTDYPELLTSCLLYVAVIAVGAVWIVAIKRKSM